ncbi:MAG: hypothetical protein E7266_00030 [Lachnospiraceae bacterium]|nr:hypothetical protein [Lachnospiraceae bacterium]
MGIGTLSEKTMHAVLKLYYCPDRDMHEVVIGNYVADIYNGDRIIEIQTQNLGKLRPKLEYYLDEYKVTVVHPLIRETKIILIDETTGEHSKPRKSPRKGNIYEVFLELYRIIDYLKHPNLEIRILFTDVEEYKIRDARVKRGRLVSSRYDRIPTNVEEEIVIERYEDYLMFIPIGLGESFYVKDFAKEAGIHRDLAQSVVSLLYKIGILDRGERDKNGYVYSIAENL